MINNKIFAFTTFVLCLICVLSLQVESFEKKRKTAKTAKKPAPKGFSVFAESCSAGSNMAPKKLLSLPLAKTRKERKSKLPLPSPNALPTKTVFFEKENLSINPANNPQSKEENLPLNKSKTVKKQKPNPQKTFTKLLETITEN